MDNPAIYINSSTPGYTKAYVLPDGPEVDAIFDEPFEQDSSRPTLICAEADATGFRSRQTKILINGVHYELVERPFLDGMGLATVYMREAD